MSKLHISSPVARNEWWAPEPAPDLRPMADLDLLIKNGWGSTGPLDIPPDWRTRVHSKRQFEKSHDGNITCCWCGVIIPRVTISQVTCGGSACRIKQNVEAQRDRRRRSASTPHLAVMSECSALLKPRPVLRRLAVDYVVCQRNAKQERSVETHDQLGRRHQTAIVADPSAVFRGFIAESVKTARTRQLGSALLYRREIRSPGTHLRLVSV